MEQKLPPCVVNVYIVTTIQQNNISISACQHEPLRINFINVFRHLNCILDRSIWERM